MKFIKKNILFVTITVFIFSIFVLPILSFAQQPTPSSNGGQPTPTNDTVNDGKIHNPLGPNGPTDIPTFIHNALIGALKIGIPIVALAIIYCGFLFVSARGKEAKLTEAKDALFYTLIGAAILLGAWAIANLIVTTVSGLG
ncbi:MAG: hypothetical protein KGL67_02840 [Patescibacteria group bacterium]|nr:hypothetical protein [Patescibacteria group bacterium]